MREILFRGKRLDNGEWIEGCLLKVTLGGNTAHLIFGDKFAFTHAEVKALSHAIVDPETVGQYTGLKDKNGRRIFEGDIVTDEDVWPMRGVVTFGEGTYDSGIYRYNGWYVRDERFGRDRCALVDYDDEWNKFVVIGNIHDNPELVNGGGEA